MELMEEKEGSEDNIAKKHRHSSDPSKGKKKHSREHKKKSDPKIKDDQTSKDDNLEQEQQLATHVQTNVAEPDPELEQDNEAIEAMKKKLGVDDFAVERIRYEKKRAIRLSKSDLHDQSNEVEEVDIADQKPPKREKRKLQSQVPIPTAQKKPAATKKLRPLTSAATPLNSSI